MTRYSIEPRARKYVKGYGFAWICICKDMGFYGFVWICICKDMVFLSFARNYKKQLLGTNLDSLKTVSKKVVYKASKYLGNKIADAVTKSNDDKIVKPDENPWNVEETIVLLEKRDKILKKLSKVF